MAIAMSHFLLVKASILEIFLSCW